MFERELCSHPAIRHVEQAPHRYNETHYWAKAAALLATSWDGFSGDRRPAAYGSKSKIRDSLVETVRMNVPDFNAPSEDEVLIFAGWEALCAHFARPVFFEKTPHHLHHRAALDLMLRWKKQSDYAVKFVGLVRNPMAVLYSAEQLFSTNPAARQWSWVSAYQNLERFQSDLRADEYHFVRYEDLIDEPGAALESVCDFIGVDRDSKMGKTVHGGSLEKWRDDPAFTFQLHPEVASFAARYGYTTDEVDNSCKAELPLFARVGKWVQLASRRTHTMIYDWIKRP